ncbi:MAG: CRISPR-associated endonuclease Cas2 [Candidatus Viridilinea halotolerans]|uniref:CRISPR-associated endoribonuclease Cas2 n=1 Tax=Candidatus Viridilinea halotolerans TaxID=2491704 RepID=A0A426TWN2_9CHLR|nr:MAG: CRISPR-associated endonuclease Cas2 [Candidatus Viridilinea halotolerans]
MLYIISYDISVDRRRTRIAKILEGHGQRVQYSVFECDLDANQYQALWRKLLGTLQPDEGDNLRIYRLCANCNKTVTIIGSGPPVETSPNYYIV